MKYGPYIVVNCIHCTGMDSGIQHFSVYVQAFTHCLGKVFHCSQEGKSEL